LCLLTVASSRLDAYAEPPRAASVRPEQAYFSYPLRAGESLNDVARIFRVPAEDLAALNQITDPNHLQIGQLLRVPDGFAQEAAALRAERDRLLVEKQRVDRQSDARVRTIADLETQLRQLQGEKNAVAAELAANVQWHKTAMVVSILLIGALAWGLKSRFDRANLERRQRMLKAENAALIAAKDRYRQAASQLELRYQNLYAKKNEEPVSYAVAEGIERLGRAFREGSSEIERLLAEFRAEHRGKAPQGEERPRARPFHAVRDLLERERVKYHTP
jgi:murein DD-endopeptidase MepM/ murein hydrolase activator NlpD